MNIEFFKHFQHRLKQAKKVFDFSESLKINKKRDVSCILITISFFIIILFIAFVIILKKSKLPTLEKVSKLFGKTEILHLAVEQTSND